MSRIELTVLLITYNHADFLETAVESVLMQETDFDYEVIVSEDFSTDGTREIAQRLAEAHPDRIRVLLSERNLNDNTVMRRGLESARGRYVALLDGDDFWTSRRKLQRQMDFLEAHPEYSSCFHNVNVVHEGGATPTHLFHQDEIVEGVTAPKPGPISTLADVVRSNFIPTCSVVFRAEIGRDLPSWFDGLASGDWPLHIVSAQHGDIAYLDEVMGTYRVHPGGIWTMNRSKFLRVGDVENAVRTCDVINEHLGFSFDRALNERITNLYERTAIRFYKRGEHRAASVCARRSLQRAPMALLPRRWRSMAVLGLSGVGQLIPRRRPQVGSHIES
jgi:glycosyltransferase involved in cell wall biosynthesis